MPVLRHPAERETSSAGTLRGDPTGKPGPSYQPARRHERVLHECRTVGAPQRLLSALRGVRDQTTGTDSQTTAARTRQTARPIHTLAPPQAPTARPTSVQNRRLLRPLGRESGEVLNAARCPDSGPGRLPVPMGLPLHRPHHGAVTKRGAVQSNRVKRPPTSASLIPRRDLPAYDAAGTETRSCDRRTVEL